MTRIGFIIADSNHLSSLIGAIRFHPDITCIIGVNDVESFWLQFPKRSKPDILFLDIDLPGESGINAIPELRKQFKGADIIILSKNDNDQMLMQALSAGATGCLRKDFPISQLPHMIKTVQNGGALLSPRVARLLIEHFKPSSSTTENLNVKEEQLLRLFYEGKTYEESAAVLGISIDGVKYHVKNIYRKLNVDNKVDALRLYMEGLR